MIFSQKIHVRFSSVSCWENRNVTLTGWQRGLRYRKNVKEITRKPDIAFIGIKVAVFCDSEFWHGYNWDNRKHDFKTHQEFWIPKIERNIERDEEVTKSLTDTGWMVLRFWGKDIQKNLMQCADIIEKAVNERHGKNI